MTDKPTDRFTTSAGPLELTWSKPAKPAKKKRKKRKPASSTSAESGDAGPKSSAESGGEVPQPPPAGKRPKLIDRIISYLEGEESSRELDLIASAVGSTRASVYQCIKSANPSRVVIIGKPSDGRWGLAEWKGA